MFRGDNHVFAGKKVLVTGNTGFKGSWLSLWLHELQADVIGYSLEAPTTPNLFTLAELNQVVKQVEGDICDLSLLRDVVKTVQPQIVFHLAAQSIVLQSFDLPLETFRTNVIGTANLLEACRGQRGIEAILIITTDKCYDNKEWHFGYRENDPLGGQDPYSASKAMAEMVSHSYRHSFYGNGTPIATARAGNVMGGGDFSSFRLIPDCMKALLQRVPIRLRNPKSKRPWMHVLDSLNGYLILAKKLIEGGQEDAEAWNFGPLEHKAVTTSDIVEKAIALWGEGSWSIDESSNPKPEMHTLKLNWDKAANRLGWQPQYDWKQSIEQTVRWFQAFEQNPNMMKDVCIDHIQKFMSEANNFQESFSASVDSHLSIKPER